MRKRWRYVRTLSVGVAFFSAVWVNFSLLNQLAPTALTLDAVLIAAFVQTVGFALVVKIADSVDRFGFGNGLAVVAISWSAGAILRALIDVWLLHRWVGIVGVLVWLALFVPTLIWLRNAQRRIPVSYPRRVVVRRQYGAHGAYIPVSIFLMLGSGPLWGVLLLVGGLLAGAGLIDPLQAVADEGWWSWWGLGMSIVFVVSASLGPVVVPGVDWQDKADELRRGGGFIPGIRPGPQTERYLKRVNSYVGVAANLLFAFPVFILPLVAADLVYGSQVGFEVVAAATIPMTMTAMETVQQINSQVMMRNYVGFLR